jgi:uncharacterized protein
MDLKHSFTVPASVDETWAAFQDIESVAECFPGAQIISTEGDTFNGTVKVKLGPIALVYKGTGTFTERDESTHRMVIDAKGKDKRGNGTAGALVTATMSSGDDGTTVDVVTDLAITGKPAQFGRGVIQDVSDKLLRQFVDCLQAKVGTSDSAQEAPAPEATAPESAAAPAASAVPDSSSSDQPSAATPTAPRPRPVAAAAEDDSLDLGAAVVPVLAKAYWKQAVGALAGLAVVAGLIRRLRRR